MSEGLSAGYLGLAADSETPIEHLDYNYIGKCNNTKEIEKLLRILRYAWQSTFFLSLQKQGTSGKICKWLHKYYFYYQPLEDNFFKTLTLQGMLGQVDLLTRMDNLNCCFCEVFLLAYEVKIRQTKTQYTLGISRKTDNSEIDTSALRKVFYHMYSTSISGKLKQGLSN